MQVLTDNPDQFKNGSGELGQQILAVVALTTSCGRCFTFPKLKPLHA
jgi:hypothetical protein